MTATASAPHAPPAAAPVTGRRLAAIFGGLLLSVLLAALDSTIVATALPTIVSELGGLDRLAWVVTAYLLAQTVVTPLYGKLGDLYGRRIVLQSAIVLFLVGSALCGLSRSMMQLVLFRAIQGLGGGGLMVSAQAAIADVVPPRDRGRYQGIFGAAFGVASIAGPLLGGYFTTHWSWRWIFYINLPLGLAALVALAITLPARSERVRHRVDYLGAALAALVLAAVVLLTDLGGTMMAWTSPGSLALAALAAASLAAFVFVERRAAEPVLPLHLFRNRAFVVSVGVGFAVGFALFGSVTYLPLFLQVIRGASPTASGLQMLPQMGGMLLTSIGSGQIISRTGRYKPFPIAGTAVMCVGLFLLSRLGPDTSTRAALGMMLVLGLGLGLVMQVLIIAVQNAVDYKDLGVATSGATLFRLVGGSLGTAALGALFASQLARNVAAAFPRGMPGGATAGSFGPQIIQRLDPTARAAYAHAFTSALGRVFLVAAAVTLAAFVLSWFMPERPLRGTVAAVAGDPGTEAGDAFAMPRDPESIAQLIAGLLVVADRDTQRRYMQGVVARAGVALSPLAAWLLMRLGQDASADPHALAREHRVPTPRTVAAMDELRGAGLIDDGQGGIIEPTDEGCVILERLLAARREHLRELASEWHLDPAGDAAATLRRLTADLVPGEPLRRSG
jgi:EmrB/QacA subfamily drug resistance transporter